MRSASACSPSAETRHASGSASATGSSTSRRTASARSSRRATLNPFLALGRSSWEDTLARVDELVDARAPISCRSSSATSHLPFAVADYVDFYSSLEHATNLGRLFRPDSEPLLPNWRHLPVGYHGRAGTVVVSGTPVVRPAARRRRPTTTLRASGRAGGSTSSSSSASSSASGARSGEPVPASALPRPRLRRRARQRLERARHPGVGVPAARARSSASRSRRRSRPG